VGNKKRAGFSRKNDQQHGSYTVSWGSVSTATSYTLQESSNGGSSWSTAYTGSATSKALNGKGNGTYTYRAEACNAGGCGAWSATHAIKVALIPVVSGLPLTLSVTGPDFKPVVHVSWSAVPAGHGIQAGDAEGHDTGSDGRVRRVEPDVVDADVLQRRTGLPAAGVQQHGMFGVEHLPARDTEFG
jgi:hypothetical protein